MIKDDNKAKNFENVVSSLKDIYRRTIVNEIINELNEPLKSIRELNEEFEENQIKANKTLTNTTNKIKKTVDELASEDDEEFIENLNQSIIDSINSSPILTNQNLINENLNQFKAELKKNDEACLNSIRSLQAHLNSNTKSLEEKIGESKEDVNLEIEKLTKEIEMIKESESVANNKLKNLSFIAYAVILFEIIQIILQFV
ncbi:hypothetical protein [Macrococcus capreoli]|uniref:hypothetical protein n=1 Tax=Macrococcus capreoli TaxID=2982690 RepID=UPI003EE7E7C8